MTKKIKVVIVDDYQITREGVKSVLLKANHFDIVAETPNGREAIEICQATQPDFVLLDIELSKDKNKASLDGFGAGKLIRKMLPKTKIVIISRHKSREEVHIAREIGAIGYYDKSDLWDELPQQMIRFDSGRGFFCSSSIVSILADLADNPISKLPRLSSREYQILYYQISLNKTIKEIAELENRSIETIKKQSRSARRKLGAKDKEDLVRIAKEIKLFR